MIILSLNYRGGSTGVLFKRRQMQRAIRVIFSQKNITLNAIEVAIMPSCPPAEILIPDGKNIPTRSFSSVWGVVATFCSLILTLGNPSLPLKY